MAERVLVITGSTANAELGEWLNELQPTTEVHTSDLSANGVAAQIARELGLLDVHHYFPMNPEWVCQSFEAAAMTLLADFRDIQEVHNFAPFSGSESVYSHLYRLFTEKGVPVYHH